MREIFRKKFIQIEKKIVKIEYNSVKKREKKIV